MKTAGHVNNITNIDPYTYLYYYKLTDKIKLSNLVVNSSHVDILISDGISHLWRTGSVVSHTRWSLYPGNPGVAVISWQGPAICRAVSG